MDLKQQAIIGSLIAASGAGSAGGIYVISADYNKDISELRIEMAVCKEMTERHERELNELWRDYYNGNR